MEIPTDCVCLHLRMAARTASRLYDEALAAVGLRNTQFSLLAMLHEYGPVPVTELADIAVMERTTLTRNLGPLEREKLVVSEPGEDKRMREVRLTDRGRSKLEAALPVWRKAQKRMVGSLGRSRKERMLKDLAATTLIES